MDRTKEFVSESAENWANYKLMKNRGLAGRATGHFPQLAEHKIPCPADFGEVCSVNISVMNTKKRAPTYTTDDQHPGAAHRLYHRINEVRSARELCASYLLVQPLNGAQFYIPAGIFPGRNAQADHLLRTITDRSFDKRIWTRLPLSSYLAQPGGKYSQPGNKWKRIPRRFRRTNKTSADFLRWLSKRDALTKQATEENTERTPSPQDGN
jgi:hypothetical protein